MLKLFVSKESYFCLFLIIIQQVIVAFSTIFIAELAESIAVGKINWIYLCGFLFCLTIVYIPATLSRIYLEKIKYLALHKYIAAFVNAHLGKIHLGLKDEEEKLPYITSEGQSTIEMVVHFFYEFFSIFLNVIASLLALSYVVDPLLLGSYLFSFLLLSAFIFFSHAWIANYSRNAQDSRANVLTQLIKSWNNIVVNNSYNYKIWKNRFENSFEEAKNKNVDNEALKQFVSSAGMVISLLPLLGTLIYLLYTSIGNIAFQALLVATLPRQIQMIQNMDVIIQLVSEWADIKQRVLGLKKALVVETQNPEQRIQWDKLQFYLSSEKIDVPTIDSLNEILAAPKRLTIRGKNGTGKSTLLKYLKEQSGGYYLPAKPSLSFASPDWQTLSTGEQVLVALQEACSNNNIEKRLLLDEWDANLDSANREKISKVIEDLSRKMVVIEVVHRK